MSVRLSDPIWLALLAAMIPMGIVGVLWFRAMSRARRWMCLMRRWLLLTCVTYSGGFQQIS